MYLKWGLEFALNLKNYLVIINSHIPLKVSFLWGDCSIAIVIRAIYEYGGLTNGGRVLSSAEFGLFVGVVERAGRRSNGDGDTDDEECIIIAQLSEEFF